MFVFVTRLEANASKSSVAIPSAWDTSSNGLVVAFAFLSSSVGALTPSKIPSLALSCNSSPSASAFSDGINLNHPFLLPHQILESCLLMY